MQTPLLDLYRASLRSTADVMNASLESTVRFHERQLDLANAQLERAAGFWAVLWRAAGDAQKSMIDRVQAELEQVTETAPEADEAPEGGVRDATEVAASQLTAAMGQARRRAG